MPGQMPAPAQSPAFSQDQMNDVARKRGYRDYNHMIYVMQNRLPQPKTAQEKARSSGGVGNFLRDLWNDPSSAIAQAFAWHPSNTIGRAADAVNSANQRGK